MATDVLSPEILRHLRTLTFEDSLEISVRADWGSDTPQFRENIHAAVGPKVNAPTSSISHAPGLGGFASLSDAKGQAIGKTIGFDIEPLNRVTAKVVGRVSRPEELLQASSPGHLWVAKEAVFKALKGPRQPQVLSQISITGWQKAESQIETFEVSSLVNASKGAVFVLSSFVLAVFIFSPQNLP